MILNSKKYAKLASKIICKKNLWIGDLIKLLSEINPNIKKNNKNKEKVWLSGVSLLSKKNIKMIIPPDKGTSIAESDSSVKPDVSKRYNNKIKLTGGN